MGLSWLSTRRTLLLALVLDLMGVVVIAVVLDHWTATHLLWHPQWLGFYGATYVAMSWLFGSYTLLRLTRVTGARVLARLGGAALATTVVLVLVNWSLRVPPSLSLGHRRTQALLLLGLTLWALIVRLLLRRLPAHRGDRTMTDLERAEWMQQRLLPSQLPLETFSLEEVPWTNSLSLQRQLKRAADIVLAICLLLLTLPLTLSAALWIWLEDRGPIFFRQERSGLMGARFSVYKLRTMAQADPGAPALWTQRGDKRLTRVGALLRRVRLDEIPQLLNVVLGEMSLIGPRPERPELEHELEARIPHYRKRHWMPPGLSGWAQVCAPYAASIEETELKLSYDLYYLRHWSTALDLLIFLKTIKTVLKAKGR
jgi:lipopolysaccharide/colanic/teichoic acid biosynthesis glycosyltransferase